MRTSIMINAKKDAEGDMQHLDASAQISQSTEITCRKEERGHHFDPRDVDPIFIYLELYYAGEMTVNVTPTEDEQKTRNLGRLSRACQKGA